MNKPRNVAFLMKVFVLVVQSLDHQAEFVSLVAPVAGETVFADVVGGETTNLGFRDFEGSLVVNVLVVARAEVVDDGHCLAHEVHHVLGVGAGHVVLCEHLANALSEDETDVGNSVLVAENGTDFGGGVAGLGQVENEGLNRILIGVGPLRCLGNVRTGRATLAFSGLVHSCHITPPSGLPTYLPFLITPPHYSVLQAHDFFLR